MGQVVAKIANFPVSEPIQYESHAAQQTVLITSGATSIGFTLAEKFHSAGNRLILIGRSEDALLRMTQALPGTEACSTDISNADDKERLIPRYPDVTTLVNNAEIQIN